MSEKPQTNRTKNKDDVTVLVTRIATSPVAINSILIITLNVNGLNIPIKRLSEYKKTKRQKK